MYVRDFKKRQTVSQLKAQDLFDHNPLNYGSLVTPLGQAELSYIHPGRSDPILGLTAHLISTRF